MNFIKIGALPLWNILSGTSQSTATVTGMATLMATHQKVFEYEPFC